MPGERKFDITPPSEYFMEYIQIKLTATNEA